MTTPAAAPKRRSLVPGILLGVLAVILMGIGGIVYGIASLFATGTYTRAGRDPELDRGGFRGGEATRSSSTTTARSTRAIPSPCSLCTVENGGETQEVSGADRGGVSVEVGEHEWIGDFTAQAGPTTVTCDFASGRESTDYFYFVQPAAPPAPVGTVVLLVLGGVLLLGAAALILRAVVQPPRHSVSARLEELDFQSTPMGELTLRRRHEPMLDVDVYEVKLGDEYLMSSLFTVAEEELARRGLGVVDGDELDVLVGGLGLGYTAVTALHDDRASRR